MQRYQKRRVGASLVSLLLMLAVALVARRGASAAPMAPQAISVAITSPANGSTVTTNTFTFTGTSTPGSTLTLRVDGGGPIALTADASGNWSYTATLAAGPHTARVDGSKEIDPLVFMTDPSCGTSGDPSSPGDGTSCVRVADSANGQILTAFQTSGIDSKGGEAVLISPDQTKVYVAHFSGVDVFRTSDYGFIRRITTPLPTQLGTVAPNGDIWVSMQDSGGRGGVAVISTATDTLLATIDTFQLDGSGNVRIPSNPHDVVISPDGARAYVADRGDYGLLVIDTATRTVIGRYDGSNGNPSPAVVRRMIMSADGSSIWTTARSAGRVFRFNTATNTGVYTGFNTGTQPEGIALTPDESRLWVARYRDANGNPGQTVAVINTATNAVVAAEAITLPATGDEYPRALEKNPYSGLMYVATEFGVYVYDPVTRAVQPGRYIAAGVARSSSVYDFAWLRRFDVAAAQISFTVDPTSDVAINKSHTGSFVVGQQATYNLVVNNNGPAAAAAPVTVSDTLPAGLTYVSATGTGWACSVSGQTVTCVRNTALPAGATAPAITLTVNVGAAAAPSVTNRGCVSASNDDVPGNNCDDDPTVIVPQADLAIDKSHAFVFVEGQQATYDLVVRNLGPSPAAAPVTVSDTLPAGLTYVSATGTGWACSASGQVVTCTRNTALAAGATAPNITLTVNVGSTAAPSVTNRGCVSSPTQDPVATNNCDDDPTVIIEQADLSVVKSHSGTFTVGQQGSYQIAVTNNGPSIAAAPITVRDTLPTGLTFAGHSGAGWSCTPSGSLVDCQYSFALAVGETSTLTLVVNVTPAAAQNIVNRACVSATTTPDPISTNDCDDDPTVIVYQADLAIQKDSDSFFVVGSAGQYTLVVRNLGPSTSAAPITVTDTLPNGLTLTNASGTGWACSNVGQALTCVRNTDMPAGSTAETITINVQVALAAAPSVTNTATVTGTTVDPNPPNNTSTIITPVLAPSLAIVKSANPVSGTTVAANDIITYTLRVENTGTLTLTSVIVTDAIPEATAYTGYANPTPASGPDPIVWNIGTLNIGQSATVSYSVRVLPIGTTVAITNTAEADSAETPPVPSNTVIHPFDPTAVTMVNMSTKAEARGIRVSWTTGSEADTLGFLIYRSTTNNRAQAQLVSSSMITSQGAAGGSYSHLDTSAPTGQQLWYWIEETERGGSTHQHGPLSAAWYRVFIPLAIKP